MDLAEFTTPVLVALSGQVLLLLAGLAVLSRLFLTRRGREGWHQPSPLAPLPWNLFEFALAAFVVFAGAVAGQIVSNLIVEALPLSEEEKLTLLGAGFQLGMLAGAGVARLTITQSRPPIAIDEPAPADPPALPPEHVSPDSHSPWIAGPLTLLAALPVLFTANLGWMKLLKHYGFDTGKQPMVEIFASSQSLPVLLGMTFLAVVVAPVTEEVVFRAGLFRYLRTRLPRSVAVILPALVFGTLHGNLVAFLPLVLLGIVFALAYERTGRLSVPIVAHALFNLNTILMLLAGVPF